jgi:hypothetical protein
MRFFVVIAGITALVAAPCAWDTPPGEAPPIAALLAGHTGVSAPPAGLVRGMRSNDRASTTSIENLKEGNDEAL